MRPTHRCGSARPTRRSDPVADDPADHEHHANEDDQVSEVLTDREPGNDRLRLMRDDAMLDEVEEEADGHDGDAEP